MSYYVIADEDTVLAFRYAGVPGEAVEGSEQALAAFRRVVAGRENVKGGEGGGRPSGLKPGLPPQTSSLVVILTEEVAASIRSVVNHVRFEVQTPVVVEVPGAAGPLPGRPDLLKLIQEAVRLRL